MKFIKKAALLTIVSLISLFLMQLILIGKASAAPLATSSQLENIKSLYIPMKDYPIIGSNWPSRNEDGCGGSKDQHKVFPWLGQYDNEDETDGNPLGTGNHLNEAGNCSNKYLDGGTNTAPLYTSLAGPWIDPTAYAAWANGNGMGPNWKPPVDTTGCETDSDVVNPSFTQKHIWGQCDIDMTNQSSALFSRIGAPYTPSNDGRNLYSNGSTLFVQKFNVTAEQLSVLADLSYTLDFNAQADDFFAVYINGVFVGGSTDTAAETQLAGINVTNIIKEGENVLAIQVIDKAVWVQDGDTETHKWRDAGIAYELNLTPRSSQVYDLEPSFEIGIGDKKVYFKVKNNGGGESVKSDGKGVTVKRYVKIKGVEYVISPDATDQKILGGKTNNYDFVIPATINLTPGDEVCAYISVSPASGVTGGNITVPERSSGSRTSPICETISSRPYFRAYGSDVVAGRRFKSASNLCRVDNQYIRAYNIGSGTNWSGSGVQFAASATGIINGFMSVSMHSGSTGTDEIPKPNSGLTFSNTVPNNLGNDEGAYAGCMGDYKTLADNIISNSNGSINWVGSRTISSSADLTNNMLFVNGNLTINGNIDSENTTYSKLSDVRTNLIVVMGNIYIKSNVANLDGLFVALPDGGMGGGGVINTCGTTLDPPVAGECDSSLTVNGAFLADRVLLNRLHGDINSATEKEADDSTKMAEKFIFTPDFYLGLLNTKNTPPQIGSYKYDSISNLPPVL